MGRKWGLGWLHHGGTASPPRGLQGALISSASLGSHSLRLPGPEASSHVTCLPRAGGWGSGAGGWGRGAQRVGPSPRQHPLLLPPCGPFLPRVSLLTHRLSHPSMSPLPLPSPALSGDTPPPLGALSCWKPLSLPWGLTLSPHGPLSLSDAQFLL